MFFSSVFSLWERIKVRVPYPAQRDVFFRFVVQASACVCCSSFSLFSYPADFRSLTTVYRITKRPLDCRPWACIAIPRPGHPSSALCAGAHAVSSEAKSRLRRDALTTGYALAPRLHCRFPGRCHTLSHDVTHLAISSRPAKLTLNQSGTKWNAVRVLPALRPPLVT